jgi:hypothetical protein
MCSELDSQEENNTTNAISHIAKEFQENIFGC